MSDFEHLTAAESEALRARVEADIEDTMGEEDRRIQAGALADPDSQPGLITRARRLRKAIDL